MKLVVIYSAKQAEIYCKIRNVDKTPVLALTPLAAMVLDKRKVKFQTLNEKYKSYSHIRNIIQTDNIISQLRTKFSQSDLLPAALAESVIIKLFYALSLTEMIRQALSGYDEFLFPEENKLKSRDLKDSIEYLLELIMKLNKKPPQYSSSAAAKLARMYNRFVIRRFRKKKTVLLADNLRGSTDKFLDELHSQHPKYRLLSIRRTARAGKTFAIILNEFLGVFANLDSRRVVPLIFYSQEAKHHINIHSLLDTGVAKHNNILKCCESYIQKVLDHYLPSYNMAEKLGFAANIVICENMIHPVNLLLGGSAISKGGKVVLFNHGTTSYNKYAVSRKVQALWQSMGRSVSNFANVYIAKTPYARDFIHKEYHKQAEILQLYADEKYTITPSTNKDFTLLYANTLMPFQNHVPWIYETSFEYLESLKTLCEAVIKTEGIKLIIRHRATSDLDNEITEEVLKYFLPKSDKITFDDKRSFEDAINHSDMLVSSLSVTIDEALNMRKPVLLHSYDNRYAHLDAMAEPPSEYNRSAVYRRRDSVTLEHLLTELAKQHKGRELIDKEIVHYIFPPNEGSMSNLVAHVTKQPA